MLQDQLSFWSIAGELYVLELQLLYKRETWNWAIAPTFVPIVEVYQVLPRYVLAISLHVKCVKVSVCVDNYFNDCASVCFVHV